MSQPPGTPPHEWQPRTDAGARSIIDHFNTAKADITESVETKLDERLRSHVTWPGIWGSAIGLLGLVATLVFTLVTPVKDAVAAERKERLDQNKDMAGEFRELRKSMDADRKELSAAVQAIKDVIVEGKARREASQELRRKIKEK